MVQAMESSKRHPFNDFLEHCAEHEAVALFSFDLANPLERIVITIMKHRSCKNEILYKGIMKRGEGAWD